MAIKILLACSGVHVGFAFGGMKAAEGNVCKNIDEATGKRCGWSFKGDGGTKNPKYCQRCGASQPGLELAWKPNPIQHDKQQSVCENIHEATGKRCGWSYTAAGGTHNPKCCPRCGAQKPDAELVWKPNPRQNNTTGLLCNHIHEVTGRRCGWAFTTTHGTRYPKFCPRCGNPKPGVKLFWHPSIKKMQNVTILCNHINTESGKRCGYAFFRSAMTGRYSNFCHRCGNLRPGADLNWITRKQVKSLANRNRVQLLLAPPSPPPN